MFKTIFSWFKPTPAFEVNPTEYGWVEQTIWNGRLSYKLETPSNTFYLYQSHCDDKHWVFDLDKKTYPGNCGLFNIPLLREDLEYMRCHIKTRNEIFKSI